MLCLVEPRPRAKDNRVENFMIDTFILNGQEIFPGERKVIDLAVARLYTHVELNIPVQVLRGRKPGPTLFVSAAIHGDELNGVEIVRRLVNSPSMKSLRGTLIAIPVVNVFGIIHQSRYLPDRRDLNRCFPGSNQGSLAARLANIFVEEVVEKSDYGIDLHTGAIHRSNLPQIRANLDDPATLELAQAFGVPLLLNANMRDGSLRQVASEMGVPVLLYEAGEALRFDELSIRGGVKGILSVMRKLEMLPKKVSKKVQKEPFIARSSSWVRASQSGLLRSHTKLGMQVEKGSHLGTISDPSDLLDPEDHRILSKEAGIVIGISNIPLANEGDALFHIARFEDVDDAAAQVEEFQSAEGTDAKLFDRPS